MTDRVGPAELRATVAARSRRTLAAAGASALAVGSYGGWLAGDYAGRPLATVVLAAVAAYLLVQRPTPRAVVARGLFLLAGLVLVTPAVLQVPLVTTAHEGVTDPVGAILHPGVALLAVGFAALAAALAGVAALIR